MTLDPCCSSHRLVADDPSERERSPSVIPGAARDPFLALVRLPKGSLGPPALGMTGGGALRSAGQSGGGVATAGPPASVRQAMAPRTIAPPRIEKGPGRSPR